MNFLRMMQLLQKNITGVIAMGGRMLSCPQEATQVIACLFLNGEGLCFVPAGFPTRKSAAWPVLLLAFQRHCLMCLESPSS